jgi:hypothetical protein
LADSTRSTPEYTLKSEPRRKPTRVIPESRARSDVALLDGRAHFAAMFDPENLAGPPHDPFRHEEARGELEVVAGRPHRDRQSLAADADLARLLDRDALDVGSRAAPADAVDRITRTASVPSFIAPSPPVRIRRRRAGKGALAG